MRIFLFLLLFSNYAIAYKALVTGSIPALANKKIVLYSYTDFFSKNKVLLSATQKLDEQGKFEVFIDINKLTFVSGIISGLQFDLYIQPSKVYEIKITDSLLNAQNVNAFTTSSYFNYLVKCNDTNDVNKLITKYQYMSDEFYSINYSKIINKSAAKEFADFESKTKIFFKKYNNYFITKYVDYNNVLLANICLRNVKKISAKYLSSNIALDNYTLPDIVAENYFNYLGTLSTVYRIREIDSIISRDENFVMLTNACKKDTTIVNDTLRELVIVYDLFKNLYKDQYDSKSLYKTLLNASNNSSIEEVKNIAKNLCEKYTRGNIGYKINLNSTFINDKQDTVKLIDYTNKNMCFIIGAAGSLDFWTEMKLMPRLQKLYGNKFHFIVLNVDYSFAKMLAMRDRYKYDMTFLDASANLQFLESINLKSLPSFYLVSYTGKIIQNAGLKASTQLESKLIQQR